jgi:hypothetical protein
VPARRMVSARIGAPGFSGARVPFCTCRGEKERSLQPAQATRPRCVAS